MTKNIDSFVVKGFGQEWTRFDQSDLGDAEFSQLFENYFHMFPWDKLGADAVGFDLGCGSGRWALGVAPRVGFLHCIDPSAEALDVARRNLAQRSNVTFHLASVDQIPLPDGAADFAYCLGVLHHVPDTMNGLRAAAAKLRPGAPFLVYLYYAFDNRPMWYRLLHKGTESFRWVLSRSPFPVRYWVTQLIAALVYWPMARLARLLDRAGVDVASFPLASYRDTSLYTMRTDALDRFGTKLEQRFSRTEIQRMMDAAGFRDVIFSDHPPYWCAIGIRR